MNDVQYVKSWYDYHDRVCLVTIFVQLWWWYHLENTMHYICQTSPASLVWIFLKSQQPPWSGTGPLREPPTPCTQWLKRGGKEKVHVQVKTLRLLHVFVSPRQWNDHWQHWRGGALGHVINSAPPTVPFDTPVTGMEKATETVLIQRELDNISNENLTILLLQARVHLRVVWRAAQDDQAACSQCSQTWWVRSWGWWWCCDVHDV